jgi:hypothetical protein
LFPPDKPPAPPTPPSVSIHFSVTPEGAKIVVDGKLLTGDLSGPASERPYQVEISAPKHKTQTLSVPGDRSQTIVLRLEPEKPARPPPKRSDTAPAPKPRDPDEIPMP